MKYVMFALMVLVLAVITFSGAFAQTVCTNCCNGGPCTGGSANTSTLDVTACDVSINGRTVQNDVTVLKAFERGQNLDIKVEFASAQDARDVQVMAFMTGYRRGNKFTSEIFDITPVFNIQQEVSYEKVLTLRIPDDFQLQNGDQVKIRIEISDKYSHSYIQEYNLLVEAPSDNIVIQDVILDPANKIDAGKGLFASVRIKNMGSNDEQSIKITASMPDLGIKATQYIDILKSEEATTSEDMFLRIPACAKPGNYVVQAIVDYADGDQQITNQTDIQVLEDPTCQLSTPTTGNNNQQTVVTVPGSQDVVLGTSGTVYPVILENKGVNDKAYQLSASGLDSWATYRFDPGALVLVKAGQTSTAYLYVTPKTDAQVGQKVFMVSVQADGDTKDIALTANVIAGQTQSPLNNVNLGDFRQGLTIGLIVLVVLFVILGLVIGFNKLNKGNGHEPDEAPGNGQTYY